MGIAGVTRESTALHSARSEYFGACKAGVAELVVAPAAELDVLRENLRRALTENAQLKQRLEVKDQRFQESADAGGGFDDIVGESSSLRRVFYRVEQVAPTDANVLILGETGTGKDLIARAIHRRSGRRERPLVIVNCAAVPSSLIESEFFGHEKGAFTGALSRRIGRFEIADGATIFLDEIGDLALDLQAKLLRVLQYGEFERVGSTTTLRADVRVIAATNRQLGHEVDAGLFRPDLFYRLNVFPIELPPLRERRDDIELLVWHFIAKCQAKLGKNFTEVAAETMDALLSYAWPGNVRELENVIERAAILSYGPTLRVDDGFVGAAVAHSPGAESQRLDDVERAHILRVIADCGGCIKGKHNAAERLGLNPSTLRSRMKKLGIERLRSV